MKLNHKPAVYSGGEDSELLAKHVAELAKGKSVLDIGCGAGIQAITAALNGASKVVAVDVNSEAVKLTRENVKLNKVNIDVRHSDLFSNVTERFDLIVFNAPYLPLASEIAFAEKHNIKSDDLRWSGGKQLILKFLELAPNHLNENSKVLIVYSSLTGLPDVKGLRVIDKIHYSFEDIYVAEVYPRH